MVSCAITIFSYCVKFSIHHSAFIIKETWSIKIYKSASKMVLRW